ncbi:MAG: SurA N-terminal domain-containing protein, partial [Deltaproteobacteria bacterium]|nr:SurA N-terminal domain-containing protein [Deltaproteobacteria bacterium]
MPKLRFPIFLLFFLGIFSLSLPLWAEVKVDRIVAQVNRSLITLSELEARLKVLSNGQKAALRTEEGTSLEAAVLNMMIEEELIAQTAAVDGIVVTDADIQEALKNIQESNQMNEAQFRVALESNGISLDAFLLQIKFDLLKRKIVTYNIASQIVIPEEEVTNYLAEHGLEGVVGKTDTGVNDTDKIRIIYLPSSSTQAHLVLAEAARIRADI